MVEFKKNGVTHANLILEYHIEPDGSIWEPVFYHSNPAEQLFSSSDNFAHGVVKSSTMFFNFNVCKELTSWEFLVFQRPTNTDAYVKYRWTQTNNPMTTTSTSGVTVVTGYSDPNGGLCRCNASTYLAKTGTTSSWWNACGSWTAHGAGIPGFANTVVSTGDVAVFVRIDGTNISTKTKIYKNTGIVITNNYTER